MFLFLRSALSLCAVVLALQQNLRFQGGRFFEGRRSVGRCERRRLFSVALSYEYELAEYDVVEYRLPDDGSKLGLGAVLSSGMIQPLCVWSEDGKEFVWDERVEPFPPDDRVVRVVDDVWPSTRLVDGGLGPRNPHGEESEEVYHIERDALSKDTIVAVDTEREVWW